MRSGDSGKESGQGSSRKTPRKGNSRRNSGQGSSRKKPRKGNSRRNSGQGRSRKKSGKGNSRKNSGQGNSRKKSRQGNSRKNSRQGGAGKFYLRRRCAGLMPSSGVWRRSCGRYIIIMRTVYGGKSNKLALLPHSIPGSKRCSMGRTTLLHEDR